MYYEQALSERGHSSYVAVTPSIWGSKISWLEILRFPLSQTSNNKKRF